MAEKVTMVIDCDPGIDDAVAIMMALGQPNVNLIGVTCVTGNVEVDKVTINALRVLEKFSKLDIPVFRGASQYIITDPKEAKHVHGTDGLGDIPNPGPMPSRDLVQSEHAVQALIRMANEKPGQITLVAIGPLTNLALAIRLDPTFTSKLKELVIMGGNIEARGTGFWTAEFNFGTDPEAAHIVLTDTQCPTLVVPLETCISHSIDFQWFYDLASSKSPRGQFMHAITKAHVKNSKECYKRPAFMVADACAMLAAVCRGSVQESTHTVCKVELVGKYTRGQMVTNKVNTPWIPDLEGAEREVVTKLNMDTMYKLLNDAVA
ncbi:inosine-uridine preferring nucleoside hydrolase-like [Diadema antillarum]|uniref:inosine-uridine preferring nucleoside hydrolase-like n=1 Tax=Diadema antillarum TaxID=105358 RepID=UPI003A85AAD9